jgi:anti-sigma factor RsiW
MSAIRELTCQEIVELVTDYLEGAMDAGIRAAFEAHLVICDGCVHYLDQLEATISLAGSDAPAALSPEFQAGLVQAFRDLELPPKEPQ